jgi:hypothetical protein
MQYWYLNLTAFSEYIRPYLQKELQKDISVHAIKMALSRFDKLQNIRTSVVSRWLQKISTRTNLSILTLARTPRNIELITQFMAEKKRSDKQFFTIIEGVHFSSASGFWFEPCYGWIIRYWDINTVTFLYSN